MIVFPVCREHVLETINFLSSLEGGRSHATIILLFRGLSCASVASFVAKQACLVLWLSKPAFLNNH